MKSLPVVECESIEIKRYEASEAARWNDFCRTARNATFLFDRRFMDYHADRFTDCSLMALSKKNGKIVALLPADITGGGTTLRSHGGLTYGGWIVAMRHFNAVNMLEIWDAATAFMRRMGIRRLIYKPLPAIYARRPAEEDRYALFRAGARLTGCLLSSTIQLSSPGPMNESTRQAVKLAERAGVTTRRLSASEIPGFWQMLADCLAERHQGARPVHTLAEIELLMSRFPENIAVYGAFLPTGELAAGTLLFITDRVVHTQYIATTAEGRRIKAFTLLASDLLADDMVRQHDFFDFGTSNNDSAGHELNTGLLLQKSGLGATATVYERFELEL